MYALSVNNAVMHNWFPDRIQQKIIQPYFFYIKAGFESIFVVFKMVPQQCHHHFSFSACTEDTVA
jgi:hypothetical protein